MPGSNVGGYSGAETPLFDWPDHVDTLSEFAVPGSMTYVQKLFYDSTTSSYSFPFTKPTEPEGSFASKHALPRKFKSHDEAFFEVEEQGNTEHRMPFIQATYLMNLASDTDKRVTAALKHLNPDVGNIVPIIVKNLLRNDPLAQTERDLLPRIDYVHAYLTGDKLSSACEVMLAEKIKDAQKLWAHELALAGKYDVLVQHPHASTHVVWFTEEEAELLKATTKQQYQAFDWDEQHFDARASELERRQLLLAKEQDEEKRRRMEEFPLLELPAPPERMVGWYVVVEKKQLEGLLRVAARLGWKVKMLVKPDLMEK
ncbi:hypothetical protein BCR34DRAFT_598708 [Clohesyomyces aquaticus]|uniref:Uncharacterized protein n=1 Tax=Clohesyomyces aquaticus TaxID=1231657 RepID=A0A1Y1ZXM3_9PLEO|nr:hypothetical protein BCR34DRAFT_598708 [Clohesyomyces aquaticus]